MMSMFTSVIMQMAQAISPAINFPPLYSSGSFHPIPVVLIRHMATVTTQMQQIHGMMLLLTLWSHPLIKHCICDKLCL